MKGKNVALMDKIVEYIESQYQQNNRAPSMREIANHFDMAVSSIKWYIDILVDKGILSNNSGSRGLVTTKMSKSKFETTEIPIVGSIACGSPLLAEENIESYIPIPKAFLGTGKFFVLRANGNSMINAGINNGDYVIVKQQETAEQGDIVVALIDDEATLKRYYIDERKKMIRLHPENNDLEDMFFKDIKIQGVAKKVIKDLN